LAKKRKLHVDENRRRLVARAHGVVLEIAAGTGRNAEFYNAAKVQRLIVTDASARMLDAARRKHVAVATVEYVKADAHRLSEAVPSESVDCVVDTFGLCSFEDPAAVLQEVRRVLKPDGVALLLEHGRSQTNVALNWWLDFRAPAHAERWGCLVRALPRKRADGRARQANRDVRRLVHEAEGLEVVDVHTAQLGTVFEIAARKTG